MQGVPKHKKGDNGGPVFARFIVMPGHINDHAAQVLPVPHIRALWVAIVNTTMLDTCTPEN